MCDSCTLALTLTREEIRVLTNPTWGRHTGQSLANKGVITGRTRLVRGVEGAGKDRDMQPRFGKAGGAGCDALFNPSTQETGRWVS